MTRLEADINAALPAYLSQMSPGTIHTPGPLLLVQQDGSLIGGYLARLALRKYSAKAQQEERRSSHAGRKQVVAAAAGLVCLVMLVSSILLRASLQAAGAMLWERSGMGVAFAETLAVLTFFAVWILGITLVQTVLVGETMTKSRWPPVLFWKKWDVLQLCPTFTFFSRLPSVHYTLLIRDVHEESRRPADAWRLVPLPSFPLIRCVWNPARRVRFAVEDACRSLLTQVVRDIEQDTHTLDRSTAYQLLCGYCKGMPFSSAETQQRQFLLIQQRTLQPELPAEPLYISAAFAVKDRVERSEGEAAICAPTFRPALLEH